VLAVLIEGWVVTVVFSVLITALITATVACLVVVATLSARDLPPRRPRLR
jgi:hypothetical protein